MKYIDADKLTELISQTEKEFTEKAETKGYTTLEYRLKAEGLHLALQYITSLQQEQPEVEEELVNYFGAMPDDKDKIALARHFYELGLNARKGGLIMTQIEQIRDFVETIKKSYEGTIIPPSKQEFILALVCLLKFIDSLPADSKIERKEFQRGYEKGFKDGALGSEIIESFSAKSKELPDSPDFEAEWKRYTHTRKDDMRSNAVTMNVKAVAKHFEEWGAEHLKSNH